MKKIISLIIILLFCTNVFAMPIEEAEKFIGKDVFLVKGDTIIPCGLYGRIVDVISIRGQWYIVLDTFYSVGKQLMWFQIKNIDYIRDRKIYE